MATLSHDGYTSGLPDTVKPVFCLPVCFFAYRSLRKRRIYNSRRRNLNSKNKIDHAGQTFKVEFTTAAFLNLKLFLT
jgi:hypothetical protein